MGKRGLVSGTVAALLLAALPFTPAVAADPPGRDDCDGQDVRPGSVRRSADALRVMTYNIHFGVPADTDDTVPGTDDIDGTAKAILEQDADVVGLQEVHHKDAWHGNQPEELEKRLGERYPYSIYHTNSENNSGGHVGEAGNMLFSKHPIENEVHIPLPTGDHVRRGLHGIQVDVNGTLVWVYTSHFTAGYDDPGVAQREAEARAVIDAIGSAKEPVVFMADFNARPYDRLIPWFADHGLVDAWTALHRGDAGCTFSTNDPYGRIDFVYTSPGFAIKNASVPVPQASDHRPVVVDLELPTSKVTSTAGVLAGAEGAAGTASATTFEDGTAKLGVCDTKADGWGVKATGYDASGAEVIAIGDPASADPCAGRTATAEPASVKVCLVKSGQPDQGCRTEQLSLAQKDSLAAAPSPVRVDQVGYVPTAPKRATYATDKTAPVPWRLLDASGAEVAKGSTTVIGDDSASGDHVHHADFSSYSTPGKDFVLEVDGAKSHPFDIAADMYASLRGDSLAFFYHQRAGIEISADLVGEEYARPAGHLNAAPNQGDNDVPCLGGSCDYRLDVPHGWYDAGDQGKYVVNGGLSVWHLLNAYERALHVDGGDPAAFGDGTLKIPERDNGVPDILDESRWEMEFLMEMQVPGNDPADLAGMAHHKLHDANWTGIPTRPDRDGEARYLHSPSTAATLNLAASAAQCARLWKGVDDVFAERCLTSATTAWKAAKAHPAVYAPGDDDQGGGAYSDDNVTDEFYWAAAELFLTTGETAYRDEVLNSPHYKATEIDGYSWKDTAPLGDFSLAAVGRDGVDLAPVEARVTKSADGYVNAVRDQGYPNPGGYHWGASSGTLAAALVMATAYDLTGEQRYLDATYESMDYLLGRNALDQSYVSGYGEQAAQNQHHRFWAHQADSAYPHPPAGSLAGGPNPGLQDPVAADRLADCPPTPQRCYIDDIGSYSTNEVAINWNAPLAWTAAFLAEKSR